jgi:hypothetical protein
LWVILFSVDYITNTSWYQKLHEYFRTTGINYFCSLCGSNIQKGQVCSTTIIVKQLESTRSNICTKRAICLAQAFPKNASLNETGGYADQPVF